LQVSYGMTECCGKISMSIQDFDWPKDLQQRLAELQDDSEAAAAAAAFHDELLQRVCTSGRPFLLMEVRAAHTTQHPPYTLGWHTPAHHTIAHKSPNA
jgi:hypothetical protein